MMTCTHIEKQLSRRADGTTTAAENLQIESHIAGCAKCSRSAATMAELSSQITVLGDNLYTSKTNIARSAVQAWRQEQPVSSPQRFNLPARIGAISAIAAALAVIYVALHQTQPAENKSGQSALPNLAAEKQISRQPRE